MDMQKFFRKVHKGPVRDSSIIPSPSEADLDRGGCHGTGAGKVGSNESVLRIDSGYMVENSSYLITVVVKKDRRRASHTQEVVIVTGDPPVVLIRFVTMVTGNPDRSQKSKGRLSALWNKDSVDESGTNEIL